MSSLCLCGWLGDKRIDMAKSSVVSAKKKKEQKIPSGQKNLFGSSVGSFGKVENKAEKPVVTTVTIEAEKSHEELLKQYELAYNQSVHIFIERECILDIEVFNRCCELLEVAIASRVRNPQAVAEVKKIIRKVNTDEFNILNEFHIFYLYMDAQSELIHFVSELSPGIDTVEIYAIIDRAFSELVYNGR